MNLLLKKSLLQIGILSTTFLMACSSSPTSVQLQPELSVIQKNNLADSNITWSLNSQDRRIAHYLIEISKGDNVAELINESQSSRLTIANALYEEWQHQGLKLQSDSSNNITVQVIKLLAKVEQGSVTFENNADIVIKIELKSNNKVFSKTYKSRFTQEGVFTADSEEIGAQLSTQLSQILNEIIQDPELNAKLQKL